MSPGHDRHPVGGENDALRIADDTDYRSVQRGVSRGPGRGTAFALRVEAGMARVDDSPVNDDASTVFGG
ncbi:MAG TPA: hypothetical protein VF482_17670 [Trebonia sp.]